MLRALLARQKQITSILRQSELGTSLGGKRGLESLQRRDRPEHTTGHGSLSRGRQRRQHKAARSRDPRQRHPNTHPHLFMTEAELRGIELDRMRLEDAEAAHLYR